MADGTVGDRADHDAVGGRVGRTGSGAVLAPGVAVGAPGAGVPGGITPGGITPAGIAPGGVAPAGVARVG
jgi:hypothetical protein